MAIATNPIDELLGLWHSMESAERMDAFRALPPELRDDFFLELDARSQLELLQSLNPGEHRLWLRLLAPDDAADLIQLAGPEEQPELLAQLDEVARREVNALLAYQQDEAGGLMSPRFVRLRPDMTIDEAISYLRRQASSVETIYYAYVLDDAQRLLGVITFRDLFSADHSKLVRDLMRKEFIAATEDMHQEGVLQSWYRSAIYWLYRYSIQRAA